MGEKKKIVDKYFQVVPEILGFQFVSKAILLGGTWLIKAIAMWVITSTGRVALTSGDFTFLFTTWQGWLLIILGVGLLFHYTAFDLFTKMYYCDAVIKDKPITLKEALKFDINGLKKILSIDGLFIVMYIALIAPIVGGGISLSLTSNLYVPTFVSSVIHATPLYNILYTVATIAFAVIGILHIFSLHGALFSDMTIMESRKQSDRLIKENWKDFIKENINFTLKLVVLFVAVVAVIRFIPIFILFKFNFEGEQGRFILLLIMFLATAIISTLAMMITPFYLIKITTLYYKYRGEEDYVVDVREHKKHPVLLFWTLATVVLCVLLAFMSNKMFDRIFPAEVSTGIISHRAGGNEGAENTVSGLKTAIELGAYGSEIDIQRTKDGYYIVNHDSTFERLTGNKSKPEELTLAEVKALRIKTADGKEEPVATFEEMLDASKGHIILFVELKGATADKKMVDDAVRMIKERGMVDETVLISLDYELVNYAETNYPEMNTGFLSWAAYGNIAELNCDYLGLEGESATSDFIDAIHKQGKLAMVWTPNEENEQKHFLISTVDYIITDNVKQANSLIEKLAKRSDFERILDAILMRVS
ncbi:MAG: glycerophosphoryl diester phosphodiesterase membrane domain-containing protein [Erysipelotrichaceae bacterium]|nr:glycerophosphoryl diester phosphodiesterase membrane domain-containing protein [Erysipelotrichaceae bacterium]